MLRATLGSTDYIRKPVGQTSSAAPFKDKDSNVVSPTLTQVQYTVDYIITLDNSDYLTDANNSQYDTFVGARPKIRR